MSAKKRAPELSDWREIASLGEQLVSATSLVSQRDRIASMASRVIGGRVEVWLNEKMFRLPNWDLQRAFPSQPRSEAMRKATERHKVVLRKSGRDQSRLALAAVPIEDQGFLLGALQVSRPHGPDFPREELEVLESIASIVAVGLYAWHRVQVERFRLGELNLVSEVSTQIADVLNLDELSRRVTELIQKAFNFYYVAIFTLRPGATRLRFRSSAGASRRGEKPEGPVLEVDLGQGLIGEAAETGEVIAAPDVRADPRYRFIERLPRTRSEVVIPLKLGDRILGVLDVQADRLNAFHPNDLLVLRALADNIARAVEGARLYSDVRRRAEQLTLIAEVSRSLTSTLELGKMMKEAAALIHGRFGFQHVSLYTVHPNRRMIEYEAGSGKRSAASRGYRIALDEPSGIIPWVAREGQTVLANDVAREPRYVPSPLPPRNTKSELTVPLVFGEKVLGVLDIQSDRLNSFSEDDQLMFEALGGTIAASIRNADLFRSEQWRGQVAESLREVAGLLSENIGLDESLDAILTELERNLPVDVSVIWLLDGGDLYVAAVHGAKAEDLEMARLASPAAAAALAAALESKEPVVRKPGEGKWPMGEAAGFGDNYSSLAAPLRVNDQAVGIIALAHHEPGRYGHEAQGMSATFASYAAVAIENARLYDATQEQAYASAALLQVAQAISAPSEIHEILERIVRTMPILVGVERVALYGWDADHHAYVPRSQFGLPEQARGALWGREISQGKFPLLDAVREAGEEQIHVLRVKDRPENWRRLQAQGAAAPAMRQERRLLVTMPLTIKTDLLGMLVVEEAEGAHRYRKRRLEIIRGIGQQIAVAMQNDLLQAQVMAREHLEAEVDVARQIQRSFIPDSLPQPRGWELVARWETARQVGGDFYDVVRLPGGRLGLFVADVADKGVPAALFMALTRTLFRVAATESTKPATVMERLNDLMIPDMRQGMFVTAVYGLLDPDEGLLTYSNSGHNPPLLVRADGKVEKLTRTGMALGVIPGSASTERQMQMLPGECVLFYTDGLTEAFSPAGEIFGEERLIEVIGGAQCESAEDLLQTLGRALGEFVGPQPLADDLTMLIVRRR